MLIPLLFLLFCCNFLTQTTGYFTEIDPVPTFSDWAILPYTIPTFGRIITKSREGHFLHDTRRNYVPKGELLEHFRFFLLHSSRIYIDKSKFIREVLMDKNRVIRILRPRCWGKTMNLNMLEKFLEIEVDDDGNPLDAKSKLNTDLFCGGGELFKKLEICDDSDSMAEFGKHPVIFISLKDIRGNSYKEIEQGIKDRIMTTYQKHYYLEKYLSPNETLIQWQAVKDRLLSLMEGDAHPIDMLCSIQSLSEWLYQHHGNNSLVYLLIDDFDSPIINGFSAFGHNKTEFQELCEFMQGLLSMGINENEFLAKIIITATYRLYLDDEFAGLANITEYSLLEDGKYAPYFGFTKREVEILLKSKSISTRIEEVERWYGGYEGVIKGMYNPASIREFIRNEGQFGAYSLHKANDSFVSNILSTKEVKTALKEALNKDISVQGDEADLEIDLAENYVSKSIVLLCNGILTPKVNKREDEVLVLKLPNQEAKEFVKQVLA